MRTFLLSITVFGVVVGNLIYWDDPWLWRNYVRFFSPTDPKAVEMLVAEVVMILLDSSS